MPREPMEVPTPQQQAVVEAAAILDSQAKAPLDIKWREVDGFLIADVGHPGQRPIKNVAIVMGARSRDPSFRLMTPLGVRAVFCLLVKYAVWRAEAGLEALP